MKTGFRYCMLLLVALSTAINVNAQRNRNYIKDCIKEWGECRNVAITRTNGDLALYGKNGWATTDVPNSLKNAINELHDKEVYIDDIVLSESGQWFILYGDNGGRWSNDVPGAMVKEFKKYNKRKEVVNCVTFSDDGDWIIIGENNYTCSNSDYTSWIKDGMEEFGKVWTACVTNEGIVVVYRGGYKFLGEVPEGLKTALRNTNLNPHRVKMAGTAWFFADKDGNYEYNM